MSVAWQAGGRQTWFKHCCLPMHIQALLQAGAEGGDEGGALQAFLPMWFNRFTGKHNPGNTYTLGGMSDSYYEYLLKVWLLGGKKVRTMHRSCNQTVAFYSHVAASAVAETTLQVQDV